MSPSNSTRWCPTPEQLMILEEMYRTGVRTPNSSQIQKMTAHLSLYGRIEGKNVFYWFQNHKARERQKLRRKLMNKQHQELLLLHSQSQSHHLHTHPNSFLSFLKDGETQIKSYPAWRMDPPVPQPKKWEMQSCMMRTFCSCDDWMMNMKNVKSIADHHQEFPRMQIIKNLPTFQEPLPCCSNNNNEPLKTLQLFPINSASPNY